jgi:hypothetical protein
MNRSARVGMRIALGARYGTVFRAVLLEEAGVATYIPARRAAGIEPTAALRER